MSWETLLAFVLWLRAALPALPAVVGTPDGNQEPTDTGPPPELSPRTIAGLHVSGRIALGLRFVDVAGNESQFDEDRNLDEGFLLRDLELEARAGGVDPGIESLRLWASDVGDRATTYGMELESSGWDVHARYDRSSYTGNTDSDIHTFDVTREHASLGLSTDGGDGGIRTGFELDYLQRDGLSAGSRGVLVEFVDGFPVRQEERRLGMRLLGGTTGDPDLDVSWVAGIENLESRDRSDFTLPLPSDPGLTFTEDFDADTEGVLAFGELSAGMDLGSGHLGLELGASSTDTSGSFATFETGFFDPVSPFARLTTGVLDIEGRGWQGSIEYSRPVGVDTDLSVRFLHENREDEGALDRTIVLDEMMGDPPFVGQARDVSRHSSVLDLIELGCRHELAEDLDVELRCSYGREDIDTREVVNMVAIRFFDDAVDEYGAEARLSWNRGGKLSTDLAAGHRIRPTESTQILTAFTIEDQAETFFETTSRLQAGEGTTLSARVRYEHRESDAFDSRGNVSRYTFTASNTLHEIVTADASFTYQDFDLESDTNFIFLDPMMGTMVVPAVVTFDSAQRIWTGALTTKAGMPLRPSLEASLVTTSGDGVFDYASLELDVPWALAPGLEVGATLGFIDLDAEGVFANSDYDATILEFYVGKTF